MSSLPPKHLLLWNIKPNGGLGVIYAQLGPQPSDRDIPIGVMDTRVLAEEAVRSHNAQLKLEQVGE
jgi:hypothetical protein